MNLATFWALIETARADAQGDIERQREILIERLTQEPEAEIKSFDRIMFDMQNEAYWGELWNAFFFIDCMGGEDAFTDFRSWLIAQGENVFRKAIANPDSLADIVDDQNRDRVTFELFGYVASYAYERKTGDEMPFIPGEYGGTGRLRGTLHDEEEFPQLFPRLVAKLTPCHEWWDSYLRGKYEKP